MAAKFTFSLQSVLDLAAEDLEECEQALLSASKALKEQERLLTESQQKLAALTQQLEGMFDNRGVMGFGDSPQFAYAAGEQARELRQLIEAAKDELGQHRREFEWAQERVQLRGEERDEARVEVKSLERLREERLREHKARMERVEEQERDEAAQMRHGRRPGAG